MYYLLNGIQDSFLIHFVFLILFFNNVGIISSEMFTIQNTSKAQKKVTIPLLIFPWPSVLNNEVYLNIFIIPTLVVIIQTIQV